MDITLLLKKNSDILSQIENCVQRNESFSSETESIEFKGVGNSMRCDKPYKNLFQNDNIKISNNNEAVVVPKFVLEHIIRDVKNEIEYSKIKPTNGLYLTHEKIIKMLYSFRQSGNDFSSIEKDLKDFYKILDNDGEICIKDELVDKDKNYILRFKLLKSRSEFDFWKSIMFNTSI